MVGRKSRKKSFSKTKEEEFASPVKELSERLQRLRDALQQARTAYDEKAHHHNRRQSQSQQPPPPSPSSNSNNNNNGSTATTTPTSTPSVHQQQRRRFSGLFGGRRKAAVPAPPFENENDDDEEKENEHATTKENEEGDDSNDSLSPSSPSSSAVEGGNKTQNKDGDDINKREETKRATAVSTFLPFTAAASEQVIENLRRVAELVVIGENFVSQFEKRQDRKKSSSRRRSSSSGGENVDGENDNNDDDDDDEEARIKADQYALVFDHFWERDGLKLMVDLLNGNHDEPDEKANSNNNRSNHNRSSSTCDDDDDDSRHGKQEDTSSTTDADNADQKQQHSTNDIYEPPILLPPLEVAMQAIQSVCILIQNVSRSVSMYTLLSNNIMNQMIDLPLGRYRYATAVLRRKQQQRMDDSDHEYQQQQDHLSFADPELSELTTHFVTFLKSLAMRMNAETLQFFLKYDDEHGARLRNNCNNKKDELKHLKVDFPLYERSLEFCAAHHDSFVRVTAMNICLNTLRLVTVSPSPEEQSSQQQQEQKLSFSSSSPDGVLHNAAALPFRERLAMAQYTCAPSRVTKLMSPIFTTLAERWNALDEQLRKMGSFTGVDIGGGIVGGAEEDNGVNTAAKERNQKVAAAEEKARRGRMKRAFAEKTNDLRDDLLLLEDVFKVGLTVLNEQIIEMMLAAFVYPLLLQPLLHYHTLLSAAIEKRPLSFKYHPLEGNGDDCQDLERSLAPASGPAKTALVALTSVFQCLTNRPLLRIMFTVLFHPLSPDSSSVPTVRTTLEVATLDANGMKAIKIDREESNDNSDNDVDHPATGSSPEERSTYEFGTNSQDRRVSKVETFLPEALDQSQSCVFVLAPALAEVLEFQGQDVDLAKRTRPNPYRRAIFSFLDVPFALSDIRELAVFTIDASFSVFNSPFLSDTLFGTIAPKFAEEEVASHQDTCSTGSDLPGEVVSALCASVVFASKISPNNDDAWLLEMNEFAVHALLSCVRCNEKAMSAASKILQLRRRQTSTFLSEKPNAMYSQNASMGKTPFSFLGSPSVNDADYDEKMIGMILHAVLVNGLVRGECVLDLKDSGDEPPETCSMVISSQSNFNSMCNSVGLEPTAPQSQVLSEDEEMEIARKCATALCRLDALTTLMEDLSVTSGTAIRNTELSGLAISPKGTHIDLKQGVFPVAMSRQIYAPLSPKVSRLLMGLGGKAPMPSSGSSMTLGRSPAVPCVCEVMPSAISLFQGADSRVIADGVTWQSLYLVSERGYLIFVQPLPDESDEAVGRVITVCNIDQLNVEQDVTPSTEGDSTARRIVISHEGFSRMPPPLFLFEDLPKDEEIGPFVRMKPFVSVLDVWFEDKHAANYAYHILSAEVFKGKSQQGHRIMELLESNFE